MCALLFCARLSRKHREKQKRARARWKTSKTYRCFSVFARCLHTIKTYSHFSTFSLLGVCVFFLLLLCFVCVVVFYAVFFCFLSSLHTLFGSHLQWAMQIRQLWLDTSMSYVERVSRCQTKWNENICSLGLISECVLHFWEATVQIKRERQQCSFTQRFCFVFFCCWLVAYYFHGDSVALIIVTCTLLLAMCSFDV